MPLSGGGTDALPVWALWLIDHAQSAEQGGELFGPDFYGVALCWAEGHQKVPRWRRLPLTQNPLLSQ